MVKRHGKDRDFPEDSGNSLFLFALRGLFTVSGRVCGPPLGFRLGFRRVNFPGLAPTPTTLRFLNRHNDTFLRVSDTNIPDSAGNLSPISRFFAKNCKN